MKENKLNYKLINITALMLLLYITVSNIGTWWNILGRVIQIILPFIISFTVAYALTPVVNYLIKKGLPKWLAVLIIVLVIVFIIIFMLFQILPLVYDQMKSLDSNIAKVINGLSNRFNLNLDPVESDVNSSINDITKSIGNMISEGTNTVINKSVSGLGNFIVAFVASIYFLAYMDKIRGAFKSFLEARGKKSFNYVKALDKELGNYIKGLFIFMIIEFLEYSILLKIVGHPNWLVLSILAGLLTVVPYFGGLIANLIALLLASVTTPFTFLGTLIICAVFPQIDGYFTTPKVYGKTNNINPLITIMAVSVGGTLAGPIGIIAALPIYILIRTTYNFFKKDLKKEVKTLKDTI